MSGVLRELSGSTEAASLFVRVVAPTLRGARQQVIYARACARALMPTRSAIVVVAGAAAALAILLIRRRRANSCAIVIATSDAARALYRDEIVELGAAAFRRMSPTTSRVLRLKRTRLAC